MKPILLILMLVTSICYTQTIDTISGDVGKPGGYQRIREKDSQGNIRKVWFTTWQDKGITSREYSEYDLNRNLLSTTESKYNNQGNLIEVTRHRGNTNDAEELAFTSDGNILRKYISLNVDGNFIVYRKDFDGVWRYTAVIDGKPPKPTIISEEEFSQAENIFDRRICAITTEGTDTSNEAMPSIGLIAKFEGSNIRNTKPFSANSPFEVKWDAKGEFFSIYLYDENGTLINVLGNQNDPGEGSSYFAKSGKYYFSVSTLGDWSVKVVRAE